MPMSTSKWHTFLRYSHGPQHLQRAQRLPRCGLAWQTTAATFRHHIAAARSTTRHFTPTLSGEFRYGYLANTNRVPVGGAFNPATLGFDPDYVTQASKQAEMFPHFGTGGSNNGGFTDLGPLGYEGLQEDPLAQSVNGSLVKITGGHRLKFGGEFRNLRLNFYQYTYPSGTFSWTIAGPANSLRPATERRAIRLPRCCWACPRAVTSPTTRSTSHQPVHCLLRAG